MSVTDDWATVDEDIKRLADLCRVPRVPLEPPHDPAKWHGTPFNVANCPTCIVNNTLERIDRLRADSHAKTEALQDIAGSPSGWASRHARAVLAAAAAAPNA